MFTDIEYYSSDKNHDLVSINHKNHQIFNLVDKDSIRFRNVKIQKKDFNAYLLFLLNLNQTFGEPGLLLRWYIRSLALLIFASAPFYLEVSE